MGQNYVLLNVHVGINIYDLKPIIHNHIGFSMGILYILYNKVNIRALLYPF